jgi:proteasome lid subunit RPN8/RPN11
MAEAYETPDIRRLSDHDLPSFAFPGSGKQDFRVYFAPGAHETVADHAAEDTSLEIGGVLVGRWGKDSDGPFVLVSEVIRCDSAASRSEQVTFTHEAWADISREMDTRFADLSIVGWYHSHPDFGIFLSQRDTFIHEHFFSNPGQVAYVVDPVRKTEGVFVWRDGKPIACSHYWVGDRIRLGESVGVEESPLTDLSRRTDAPAEPAATEPFLPAIGIVARILAFLAVFLIGYLLARLPNSWQQRRTVEGTVAHYGIWKGLRPGLKEHLDAVGSNLEKVSSIVRDLEGETKAEGWQEIHEEIRRAQRLLASIESTYCLDSVEAAVVAQIVAEKIAERERLLRQSADEEKAGEAATDQKEQKPSEMESDPGQNREADRDGKPGEKLEPDKSPTGKSGDSASMEANVDAGESS